MRAYVSRGGRNLVVDVVGALVAGADTDPLQGTVGSVVPLHNKLRENCEQGKDATDARTLSREESKSVVLGPLSEKEEASALYETGLTLPSAVGTAGTQPTALESAMTEANSTTRIAW